MTKEHQPMPYSVNVQDKRRNHIRTVYVRASSPHSAVLTAVRTAREVFRNTKACNGIATRYQWDEDTITSTGNKVEFY